MATRSINRKRHERIKMKLKDLIKENDQVNERPISRSKVDYSTADLKSNIDMKWTSTDDMVDDLRQWLSAVFEASGPQLVREVGIALKQMGIAAIKDASSEQEVDAFPNKMK